jgi:hypothetical protein
MSQVTTCVLTPPSLISTTMFPAKNGKEISNAPHKPQIPQIAQKS